MDDCFYFLLELRSKRESSQLVPDAQLIKALHEIQTVLEEGMCLIVNQAAEVIPKLVYMSQP